MEVEILPQLGAHASATPEELARHEMHGPMSLAPGVDAFSFALYQSTGVALEPGHQMELVENGRIFDALVEEIRRARHSVHILVYIWRPCEPSDRVIEALLERARAGVQCRVLVDPIGSESITGDKDFDLAVEKRLVEGGCEVHYYRLLAGKVLGRILGRNHQKIAVIDGRVGITGGFGIWKVWDGNGLAREEWRDTNIRFEGPAVQQLQVAFAKSWQESGGELLPPEAFPDLPPAGPVRAGFVESHGRLGITEVERMYRLVIAAARERLWIANAYFTPPTAILEQLEEKHRQGVDVRVLAPGPVHDVKVVRASQRSTYERLLRAGVRIWEYQPSMLHSKTVVVDDWLSVVGSTNLDALSLNKLGEGSLVIAGRGLATDLERSFLRDLEHSQEITLQHGGRTSPWKRLARRITVWSGKDR